MCHQCCQGSVREPNSEADQSALHLIWYHTSQKELRDVYHSMYLLSRAPGFPSCGEVKRRRAIKETSPPFRIGCKGRHPPLRPETLLEMKGSLLLCKHMRWLYGLPAGSLWRLLQPCKVTWIDSTMS